MKRLCLSLLLILCMATTAPAGQQLTFGYGGTSLSLISIAILKQAYAKLGIDIEGRRLPAARSLVMADIGQTDGEVNRIAAIAPDHPDLIRVDVPVNRVEGIALSCSKGVDTDPKALGRLRIGIKRGNLYAERLTRDMPSVITLTDEARLLDLLRAGRLDALIVDRTWAMTLKRQPRYACLVINMPALVTIPLHHYLHKRHADLVPKISRVLREMRDSGEMEAIHEAAAKTLTAP